MILFLIIAPWIIASGEQGSSVRSAADSLMLLANEYRDAAPRINESSKDTEMNLSDSDIILNRASIGFSLGMLANNEIKSENKIMNSDPTYDLGLLLDGKKKIDSENFFYKSGNEFSNGIIAPSVDYRHSSSDAGSALQYLYEGTNSIDKSDKGRAIYTYSSSDTGRTLQYLYERTNSLDERDKDQAVYTYSSSDTGRTLQYLYEGTNSLDERDKDLFAYQYPQSDPGRTLQYLYENNGALRNDFKKGGQHSDTINDLGWLSTSTQEMPETYSRKITSTHANFDALLSSSSSTPAATPLDTPPDTYKREAILDTSLAEGNAHGSKKYALVIGINNYMYKKKLSNCVNDANAISKLLEKYGYKIIKLTDETNDKPTKNIVASALDKIGKKNEIGNVIIYYSGHGEVDEHGNFYLIPRDANSSFSSYIRQEDIDQYTKDLKNLAIIIDACNSGAFNITNEEGRLVIASCRENEPSNEEWLGSLSVFTKNLQRAIEQDHKSGNKLILQNIFKKAQEDTMKWTANPFTRQMPQIVLDSTGGTYYLN